MVSAIRLCGYSILCETSNELRSIVNRFMAAALNGKVEDFVRFGLIEVFLPQNALG